MISQIRRSEKETYDIYVVQIFNVLGRQILYTAAGEKRKYILTRFVKLNLAGVDLCRLGVRRTPDGLRLVVGLRFDVLDFLLQLATVRSIISQNFLLEAIRNSNAVPQPLVTSSYL